MTDVLLLGPWIRRFLLEHLVGERNLARNTQLSYRDALSLAARTGPLNLAGTLGENPATLAANRVVLDGVAKATASVRQIANVVNVEATSFDVLVDHSEMGSGWATESASLTETGTPQIDRISIPLHELSAMPKASQRLLDDAAFDVEGWLAGKIASRFIRAEAAAFVSGNGVDKPTGFLTHTTVDNDAWAWGSLGYVATGNDGDFATTNASDAIGRLGVQAAGGGRAITPAYAAPLHARRGSPSPGRTGNRPRQVWPVAGTATAASRRCDCRR